MHSLILFFLSLFSFVSFAEDVPFSKGVYDLHFKGSDEEVVQVTYDLNSSAPFITYKGHAYLHFYQDLDFNWFGDTATNIRLFAHLDEKMIDLFFLHSGENTSNIKCDEGVVGVGSYHKVFVVEEEMAADFDYSGTICIYPAKSSKS